MGILFSLVRLYLGIGLLLGIVTFGSHVVHAAMGTPPSGELLAAAGSGAIQGLIRMVMWAPSLYNEVIAGNRDPIYWLLY